MICYEADEKEKVYSDVAFSNIENLFSKLMQGMV